MPRTFTELGNAPCSRALRSHSSGLGDPRRHDTQYGLAAAVWTRAILEAMRVARSLRAGVVWVDYMQPIASY